VRNKDFGAHLFDESMQSLRLKACLPLLLMFCMGGCGKEHSAVVGGDATTPEAAVKGFLDWRINSRMAGAPDAAQLEEMSPYISEELRSWLGKAREEYENKKPSLPALSRKELEKGTRVKPLSKRETRSRMLGESDLFSSMFEGPTSFTMGESEAEDSTHVIPVRFMSGRQLPAINWTDRVRVVRENNHYVVADIEYANHWSLGSRSTLLDALKNKNAVNTPKDVKSSATTSDKQRT